ncbi:hypothetical protein DERF_011572 [Dermatophagoides farinae]|uniref:Uncharacterized protein n=1 Tax=Dermatophagoides farinae TaxID=6954 RepID=A0A922L375_DERFA|nr:hypothetical protein DERF_011572 [Dermatophagoides farinae]
MYVAYLFQIQLFDVNMITYHDNNNIIPLLDIGCAKASNRCECWNSRKSTFTVRNIFTVQRYNFSFANSSYLDIESIISKPVIS